jgi:arginine-tRNA-protein transferase
MSAVPAQILSHYPAIPPPFSLRLWESPPHACPYLPGRQATTRAVMTDSAPPATYHAFMDANFRRSGKIIYQPACAGCRRCQSLRVPTREFRRTKSQRRCWRKNSDVLVTVDAPAASEEKFAIYRRYQSQWHGKDDSNYDEFCDFLYRSPVDTLEFAYRDGTGRLLAIGICDRSEQSLSSVYFYFDTSECNRSPGTFGALWEIQWATQHGIPYYYLGYYVPGCAAMQYKASYHPHELLCADGVWRTPAQGVPKDAAP